MLGIKMAGVVHCALSWVVKLYPMRLEQYSKIWLRSVRILPSTSIGWLRYSKPLVTCDEPLDAKRLAALLEEANGKLKRSRKLVLLVNWRGQLDLINKSNELKDLYDPNSRQDTMLNGYLGNLLGLVVGTDAFAHKSLHFVPARLAIYSVPEKWSHTYGIN